ncbi:porimin isoform X1 [Amia ocellicauda]|uniref:porimin isoform X1 n=1 Tax=Amia ocellicauda TaxID=2972642 RepID=UPI003463D85A
MGFSRRRVVVAGQLLAVFLSVSCAADHCSSLTDCQSCVSQPNCTWSVSAAEKSPSCKTTTVQDVHNPSNASVFDVLIANDTTSTSTPPPIKSTVTTPTTTTAPTATKTTTVTTTTNLFNASAGSPKTTADIANEGHQFDAGSFVGGMVLALGMTLIVFLAYKFSCARQEVQYRTIEEHEAII